MSRWLYKILSWCVINTLVFSGVFWVKSFHICRVRIQYIGFIAWLNVTTNVGSPYTGIVSMFKTVLRISDCVYCWWPIDKFHLVSESDWAVNRIDDLACFLLGENVRIDLRHCTTGRFDSHCKYGYWFFGFVCTFSESSLSVTDYAVSFLLSILGNVLHR